MSQLVRPRQTREIQLRHPRDSCLPGLHEPGARRGQKGQNLGCRRAQWGGDCTTPDWMIGGSRRSNQGFSASTVCLSGLAEGISVCLAQQGRHLDCTFLLDEGEGEGLNSTKRYQQVAGVGCQEKPHNHDNGRFECYWRTCPKLCFIFLKQTAVSCFKGSRDRCRFSLFNERFDGKRLHPGGFWGAARLENMPLLAQRHPHAINHKFNCLNIWRGGSKTWNWLKIGLTELILSSVQSCNTMLF